jgi:hypothetical protein
MCLTVKDEIDGVIFELDRALSRRAGDVSRKEEFVGLCLAAAPWVRNEYGAPKKYESAEAWEVLTAGFAAAGPTWQLKEIAERTQVAGTVAQRISTVGWRSGPDTPWLGRSARAIQFLKVPGRWLVAAVVWMDDGDGGAVPEKFS